MGKCWYWEHGMDKPVRGKLIGLEEGTGRCCIKLDDYCKMIDPASTYDSEAFAIECQQKALAKRLYNCGVQVIYAASPQDSAPK